MALEKSCPPIPYSQPLLHYAPLTLGNHRSNPGTHIMLTQSDSYSCYLLYDQLSSLSYNYNTGLPHLECFFDLFGPLSTVGIDTKSHL